MRKITLLAVVAALMLAIVGGTAIAKSENSGKGNSGKGKATYNFDGTLDAVSTDAVDENGAPTPKAVSLTVTDAHGRASREAIERLGTDQVDFKVTDSTKIEIDDAPATLEDLQSHLGAEDVRVQAKAAKAATEFDARKVSIETEEEDENEDN